MELSSCALKVWGGQPAIKRSLNEVQRWKIWLHLHCSIPVLDISPFLSTWVVSLPPYIFLQHTIHVAGDALCRSLRFVEDIWGRHSNAVTDCSDILIPSPTISLSFPFPYIWPHPGFLPIFLSWIFCPTHSRISIPAATDLCALLLTRFAPDKVTLLILRKPPVKVHLDTYLSFKHETLKAWLFKSGSWRSRQAPRLCPRGSQSSGQTTTQSSQLVEYYQLRHIQLS